MEERMYTRYAKRPEHARIYQPFSVLNEYESRDVSAYNEYIDKIAGAGLNKSKVRGGIEYINNIDILNPVVVIGASTADTALYNLFYGSSQPIDVGVESSKRAEYRYENILTDYSANMQTDKSNGGDDYELADTSIMQFVIDI